MTSTAECVVLWLALEPATPDDAQLLDAGLQRLTADDLRLRTRLGEAGQVIVAGVSESHLEAALDRLRREFRVSAGVGRLQVAYKEALSAGAQGEGRFVSQTGGRGQYAHVKIRVVPRSAGSGYSFSNQAVRGAIPQRFIESISQGIRHAAARGVIAGCPIDDVDVELVGGSHHETDSSETAFKVAGAMAFENAAKKAKPFLTEPVMRLDVSVPEQHVSAVMTDIRRRHAQVETREARGDTHVLRARAPLRSLLGYEGQLRHLSAGRASCVMMFDRYEPVRSDPRDQGDGAQAGAVR